MIHMTNVEKSYGKTQVLHDVSMDVKEGEIYGLIGRNGAGKTTIFKIILGLTNYQAGEIKLLGKTGRRAFEEARHDIGFFIGQNFFSYMNAKDNLEYYRKLKGINDKSVVDKVLKVVELDKVKLPFKSYSMGMKQRLGIANALLGMPELLILDEPTNGLDPQGIADIRSLVKWLNKEMGMTILISSHILNELEHTANRFGIVNDGTIIKELTHQDLQQAKLGTEITVEDPDRAVEILRKNGVNVLGIKNASASLEDYYFNLVGGKDA